MTITGTAAPLVTYLVLLADDNVVLGQRLSEYIASAPELEEDLAVANIGLDHIGVAQHLYTYAAEVEGEGRSEDDFAFWRTEREFTNVLLVEQPHEGFGELIARQFLFDAYQLELWEALSRSSDERLAGIAAKALKEARYHLRHTSSWVVRLGDGTDESHRRMQDAIDAMWRFTGELFEAADLDRQMAAFSALDLLESLPRTHHNLPAATVRCSIARSERSHRFPHALPGGGGVLFTVLRGGLEDAAIAVVKRQHGGSTPKRRPGS